MNIPKRDAMLSDLIEDQFELVQDDINYGMTAACSHDARYLATVAFELQPDLRIARDQQ